MEKSVGLTWQRPGFDLGLKLRACLRKIKPRAFNSKGIMLGRMAYLPGVILPKVNTLDVKQCGGVSGHKLQ